MLLQNVTTRRLALHRNRPLLKRDCHFRPPPAWRCFTNALCEADIASYNRRAQ